MKTFIQYAACLLGLAFTTSVYAGDPIQAIGLNNHIDTKPGYAISNINCIGHDIKNDNTLTHLNNSRSIDNMQSGYHGGGNKNGLRLFIEGEFGLAIPTGALGKSDTLKSSDTTHMNGYAKMGWHLGIHFGVQINDKLGITLVFDEFLNPFNKTKFISDAFGSQSSGVMVTKAKLYTNGSVMVGPAYAVPLGNDKMKLDLRPMIGGMLVSSMEVNCTVPDGTFDVTTNGGTAFAYDLSAILRYEYASSGALTFGVGYLGSTGINQVFGETYNSSLLSYYYAHKVSMSAGEFHLSIGFRKYF